MAVLLLLHLLFLEVAAPSVANPFVADLVPRSDSAKANSRIPKPVFLPNTSDVPEPVTSASNTNSSLPLAGRGRRRPPPAPPHLHLHPPSFSTQIDHFLLALSWPENFCKENYCVPHVRIAFPSRFTVHGLWPQKQSGTYVACVTGSVLGTRFVAAHTTALETYWPNLRDLKHNMGYDFWNNQWKKHGTCTMPMFSQESYLDRVLKLARAILNILVILRAEGITPGREDFNETVVMAAFAGRNGIKKPRVHCSDRNGYLLELRFCLTHDVSQYVDCGNLPSTRSNCKTIFKF